MNTIYSVRLDEHVAKFCGTWEEAKESYLDWVDYMQKNVVTYSSVSVYKDLELMLEYVNTKGA